MNKQLEVASQLSGFLIEEIGDLSEFKAKGIRARHIASGANVYHVHNDDPENLFAFAFKTLANNSNGVAHILEHTVLCGSKRFPLKDPFLLLLKGSMNTFLNAFTFPDKTVYPASSTVEKDLFNLMDVYGDAVFKPLLKEEMFRQEGHRLEFDEQNNLQRKGIVYNEMKGNYSSHESVAGDWCVRSLFPDTAYGVDSGGDPVEIPTLDYQSFIEFHRKHYHPSQCLIFLYGNIPTERYLSFLDANLLQGYTLEQLEFPSLSPQIWTKARRLTKTYPSGPEDSDPSVSITVNWLLGDVLDPVHLLTIELLADMLLGSAASPLQRALIDSGLGEDLSSSTGLETELKHAILSVGLRGTEQGKEDDLENLILETLEVVVEQGLSSDLVEGTLRRYEFRAREIKGGGPFGLRLMRRSLRAWLHGGAPGSSLEFTPIMQKIRALLSANPRYFEQMIKSVLIDNKHRSTVTVVPDSEQNKREDSIERQAIDLIHKQLSPTAIEAIKAQQAALLAYQSKVDTQEELACLPFLTEKEIPTTVNTIDQSFSSIEVNKVVIPVVQHDIFTNGIAYIDLCFDLEHLNRDELLYLPLFSGMIPALGSAGKSYEQKAMEINLKTGGFGSGIEASLLVRSSRDEEQQLSLKLYFRIKALESGLREALACCTPLIVTADFTDQKRLKDLFLENFNEFKASIVPSGSSYAALRTERVFSVSEAIEELWRGISQLEFLESLGSSAEQAVEKLLAAFENLRKRTIRIEGLSINLTASASSRQETIKLLSDWASTLPSCELFEDDADAEIKAINVPSLEALLLPTKVSYVATSFPGSVIGSEQWVHEILLAHLLRTGYLWEEIRMKGGSYGASAGIDGMSGIFSFSSYRDPELAKTLDVFKQALELFVKNPPSEHDLLLAKIACVARDLRPMAPGEAGMTSFRRWLYGIDDQLRQEKRNQMLASTSNDLSEAARRLLKNWDKRHSALITAQDLVDKEESMRVDFRPLRHVVNV